MPEPDKWYLNLSPRYADGTVKSRAGTRIKLAAKPSIAVRLARGPQVDWTTSYAGSPDTHQDYVIAPAFTVGRSSLVDGQFNTDLDLPVVNGRTYTITAKRTGNNAQVFTKQYVTWQRIYYTVHYMNNACRDAFNAIKDDLHNLFAAANIELKLRAIKQCRKNGRDIDQEYTTTSAGVTLPETWDATDAPLARQPNHIRMVVARDLTDSINGQVEWTMTNLTTAHADRKIRISSKGPNHGTIVYENDVSTFDPTQPFGRLEVHAKLDPVPLPLACIAVNSPDSPHKELKVDLSADPSLAAVLHHFPGIGVSFTGALACRRCVQGWEWSYAHATKATLGAANIESSKVVVGSASVWLAGDKIVIDDPRMLLDETKAAESIQVRYGLEAVTLDDGTATRTNEHRVTIDLSGAAAVTTHLTGDLATIEISVRRRGALARGDVIGGPETVNFSINKLSVAASVSDNEVSAGYKAGSNAKVLTISSNQLVVSKPSDLTATFVHLSVPIVVPAGAIQASSPHHAEIDLAADPSLAAIATAMQNGRELTFKGTLKGRESMGGYSPTTARWFIGLNTRALPGWNETIVQRRLKLTIAHEIGHSLSLTRQSVRNLATLTDDANDRWYTNDHGGQGPHCHHNAHLVAAGAANGFPDTPSGQVYRHNPLSGGKLCIMYHAIDHDNMADQFCDRCLEQLKRGVANFGP